MNETPDNEIGRLLAGAVPPLREPEDRLGEIRSRVQRSRMRAGGTVLGAAAAVAALAMVVPQVVVGTDGTAPPARSVTVLGPDDCPDVADAGPYPERAEADRPGPLVPDGAVEVMRCERAIDNETEGVHRGELLDQRVLTTGVDQLVDALNELPTREQFLATLDPERQEAWADGDIPCLAIGFGTRTSLVLLYPDGGTTTVYMDFACGTSTTDDGALRFGDVLDEFDRLYEEQLMLETPDTSGFLYQGNVLVLETPEHGPRLCAARWAEARPIVSGAEQAPPPCNAPPNEVVGWDWDAVDAESNGGATWGFYFLVGTWDGARFTLTEPPRPQDPSIEAPHSVDEVDFDHSPCPEPSGGWRPTDPSKATQDALDELNTWAATVPEYAGRWLDQSYLDELDPSEYDSLDDVWNDPARFVLNVRFVGDPAYWEAQVRQFWGGALCVSTAEYGVAELKQAHDSILAERPHPETLSSGRDVLANAIVVEVLIATPELRAQLDERYGAGAVTVAGWLEPVS